MVQDGTFREDLYYRLNVVSHRAARRCASGRTTSRCSLASTFIRKFAGELKKKVDGLEPDAQKLLMRYNWPGNIRELENTIERAMLLCEGRAIAGGDLRLGEVPTAGRGTREPGSVGQDPRDRYPARGRRAARAHRGAQDVQLGAEGRGGIAGHQSRA